MARGPVKKSVKQANPATPTTMPTSAPKTNPIPPPFSPISNALRPFAATLPTTHVYTIHIDRSAVTLKKRVFTVPVCMNLIIAAILAFRVYWAAPAYLEQIITVFGYETSWTVTPSSMGPADLMGTITNRTFLLLIDYCLFGMLGSWPWEFVFGSRYSRHTGAVGWRRELGFKPTEIIVRKGRKWDTLLLEGVTLEQKRKMEKQPRRKQQPIAKEGLLWTQQDELTVKGKLVTALDKAYTAKTGYLLLDNSWDLDFKGMIDIQHLVEKGKLQLKDLDHVALVFYQGQWLVWYPHQSSAGQAAAPDPKEDSKLQVFKDKLVKMGCEDVFYRWIEIVQYETSQSGGFAEPKKEEAISELKRLLTSRKKDFEKFWQDIDGRNGLPGFEWSG